MPLDPAVSPLLPGTSMLGSALVNAYVKEILGRRTSGRVLNIGAGAQSANYRYDRRIRNTEYHTLEISNEGNPTYVGDARNMTAVPSEYYDWVLAFAVLEHVDDMHAVVREITRVLKPGGCTYLQVPFHNELHFMRDYGDYWRVSPFGFRKLLEDAYSIEEVEYWGDCVIDPVSVAVFARKGEKAPDVVSRFYAIEGGLPTVHRYVRGELPLQFTMPIYRLRVDALEYCLQVQQFRTHHFERTGSSMTAPDADRLLFPNVAVREGTIVLGNEQSTLLPN